MNRSLLLSSAAVVLAFAAGYAAKSLGPVHGSADSNASGSSGNALPDRPVASQSGTATRTTDRDRSDGKNSAPLFAPGQSFAWLEAYAKNTPNGDVSNFEFCQMCGRLDANAAAELVKTLMETSHKIDNEDLHWETDGMMGEDLDSLMMPVLIRLAQIDPNRALAALNHPEEMTLPDDAITAVFKVIARQNPEQAKAAIAHLADEDKHAAFEAMVDSLSKSDPEAVLAMLKGVEDSEDLRRNCIVSAAKDHPDLALSAAFNAASDDGQFEAIENLVDGDDAMRKRVIDWATTATGLADGVRSKVIGYLAGQDVQDGIALFQKMGSAMTPEERADAAESIVNAFSTSDGQGRQRWIAGLEKGPVHDAALAAAADIAISSIDSNSTFPLAVDQVEGDRSDEVGFGRDLRNDDIQREVRASDSTTPRDPVKEAADWVNQLPPSDRKSELIHDLVDKLAEEGDDRALTWVSQLPEGGDRDRFQKTLELKLELKRLEDAADGEEDSGGAATGALIGAGAGAIIGNSSGKPER